MDRITETQVEGRRDGGMEQEVGEKRKKRWRTVCLPTGSSIWPGKYLLLLGQHCLSHRFKLKTNPHSRKEEKSQRATDNPPPSWNLNKPKSLLLCGRPVHGEVFCGASCLLNPPHLLSAPRISLCVTGRQLGRITAGVRALVSRPARGTEGTCQT